LLAVPKPGFGANILSILATPDPVGVGGVLTIDVRIADVVSLSAYQFDLNYDDSLLNFNSVAAGDVFTSQSFTDFFIPGTDLGGVVVGTSNSIIGPGSIASTDAWLARFSFLATSVGTATLSLDTILLVDAVGDPIVPDFTSFDPIQVTITDIPEPGAYLLCASGIAGLLLLRRRRA
jgi:hypothetical protein